MVAWCWVLQVGWSVLVVGFVSLLAHISFISICLVLFSSPSPVKFPACSRTSCLTPVPHLFSHMCQLVCVNELHTWIIKCQRKKTSAESIMWISFNNKCSQILGCETLKLHCTAMHWCDAYRGWFEDSVKDWIVFVCWEKDTSALEMENRPNHLRDKCWNILYIRKKMKDC